MYAIKCMSQFLWQMLRVIHYRQMSNRIKAIAVQSMCTFSTISQQGTPLLGNLIH